MPRKSRYTGRDRIDRVRRAYSLIEVIVAIGVGGVLILIAAEAFRQRSSVQDKTSDRSGLEDVRNAARLVVNCTLPCSANVTRIPRNQGRWQLSPVCDGV